MILVSGHSKPAKMWIEFDYSRWLSSKTVSRVSRKLHEGLKHSFSVRLFRFSSQIWRSASLSEHPSVPCLQARGEREAGYYQLFFFFPLSTLSAQPAIPLINRALISLHWCSIHKITNPDNTRRAVHGSVSTYRVIDLLNTRKRTHEKRRGEKPVPCRSF